MPFDFPTFRRLLYQDALEDAINMLKKHDAASYQKTAASISSQLSAWQKSSAWNPFSHRKRSRYHESIVHQLYQAGLSASKNEAPPPMPPIHPWRSLLTAYGIVLITSAAGLWFLTYTPPCPTLDPTKGISVIIDKFATLDQPFLQKIGLNKETAERQIYQLLEQGGIDVIIHPLRIQNDSDAVVKCKSCKAQMVIYGEIEYGDPVRAFLNHYLDGEKYNFAVQTGFGKIQEEFASVFAVQHSTWAGKIYELVLLFRGIITKNMIDHAPEEAKAELFMTFDTIWNELANIALDDSLKAFALHCVAWSATKQKKEEEALAVWNRILVINPNDKIALHNAGFTHFQAGNHVLASEQFAKLLKKDTVPHVYLAQMEVLTKMNDTARAKEEERKFKKTDAYRRNPDLYQKKIDAIPAYKSSLINTHAGVSALSPSAVLNAAVVDFNSGRKADARRKLDKLSSIVDTSDLTRDEIEVMSRLYRRLGEETKASALDVKVLERSRVSSLSRTTLNTAIIRNQQQ